MLTIPLAFLPVLVPTAVLFLLYQILVKDILMLRPVWRYVAAAVVIGIGSVVFWLVLSGLA